MIQSIRWSVFAVAIVLTLLPTLGAFFAAKSVVESAVTVGLNPRVSQALDRAGICLKDVAKLNPIERVKYHKEFNQLQEVRSAYDTFLESSSALNQAYLQIFILISGGSVLFALILATWLNRRIIRSHDSAVEQMRKAQERSMYLENRESWRVFAQKLVHEVKNPLTTVQIMVGRLSRRYELLNPVRSEEFQKVIIETESLVTEEVLKLNSWIDAFSAYARMPEPTFTTLSPGDFLLDFTRQYQDYWPGLNIDLDFGHASSTVFRGDPVLLKQVLFNLAKNSAEAVETNGSAKYSKKSRDTLEITETLEVVEMITQQPIQFKISTRVDEENAFVVRVADEGPGIPHELRMRLFKPYTTSKKYDQGMGLGLAIAKKILQDHGGDIRWVDLPRGCTFEMRFPAISETYSYVAGTGMTITGMGGTEIDRTGEIQK